MSWRPFQIQIDQLVLDDLKGRLANARFPDEVDGAQWEYGANLAFMQKLVQHWRSEFDWRAQEAALNRLPHFKTELDDLGVHFIHQHGRGPRPMPLLLVHGWPDSFLRMRRLIPLLTDPAAHGGSEDDAFDVVVPSIPGFGFSDRPRKKGFNTQRIARLFARLMTDRLGYAHYGAHGGDWGASVCEQLALHHRSAVTGLHLTEVPWHHLEHFRREAMSDTEREYAAQAKQWHREHEAFQLLQATGPQTVAYALNDSPVGLAAWLIDTFREWSDCGGDVESVFSRTELLTHVTLYWVTQTINSSMRMYFEAMHHPPAPVTERLEVPTGISVFAKDMVPPPREWAERWFDVRHYARLPKGGHFAALEQPEVLAEEIRATFRPLRPTHSS